MKEISTSSFLYSVCRFFGEILVYKHMSRKLLSYECDVLWIYSDGQLKGRKSTAFSISYHFIFSVCLDIKECSDGKRGGCSHTCNEISGSYSCSCPTGWTLFTVDGTSGFNIPAVETGNQYGDVYYLNHTCVSKCHVN